MGDLIINNEETTLQLMEIAHSSSLLLKLCDLRDGSTVCFSLNRSQILILNDYLEDACMHFTNNLARHDKG